MTYRQVEIITGVARRRRFSIEEKLRLLDAAFAPGVNASEVARRHGLHVSLLFRWRREHRRGRLARALTPSPSFVPVQVTAEPAPHDATAARTGAAGRIEIVLPGGLLVRVDRQVDTEALRRVLGVLEGR